VCRSFWIMCILVTETPRYRQFPSFFFPLHTRVVIASLKHVSAVRSWHLEKSSLLRHFSDACLLKEIIHIKSCFVSLATITSGTTAITCTRLPERHVILRHLESDTTYKIIDVFIVTRLSLLNTKSYNTKTHNTCPQLKRKCCGLNVPLVLVSRAKGKPIISFPGLRLVVCLY
jgi:hypothetical protein